MFSYTQHTGETIADILTVGDPILCCTRSIEVAAAPIPSKSSKSIGSRKINVYLLIVASGAPVTHLSTYVKLTNKSIHVPTATGTIAQEIFAAS